MLLFGRYQPAAARQAALDYAHGGWPRLPSTNGWNCGSCDRYCSGGGLGRACRCFQPRTIENHWKALGRRHYLRVAENASQHAGHWGHQGRTPLGVTQPGIPGDPHLSSASSTRGNHREPTASTQSYLTTIRSSEASSRTPTISNKTESCAAWVNVLCAQVHSCTPYHPWVRCTRQCFTYVSPALRSHNT